MRLSPLLAGLTFSLLLAPLPALGRTLQDFGIKEPVSRRTLVKDVRSTYERNESRRIARMSRMLDLGQTINLPSFGVRLSAPSDWSKDETVAEEGKVLLVLMLLSPEKKGETGGRANMNLVIEDLSSSPLTLGQYTDEALLKEREFFSEMHVRSRVREMVAGARADVVQFDAVFAGFPLRYEQVWFQRGTQMLVWTFTDQPDTFESNLVIFHNVLKTLQITGF